MISPQQRHRKKSTPFFSTILVHAIVVFLLLLISLAGSVLLVFGATTNLPDNKPGTGRALVNADIDDRELVKRQVREETASSGLTDELDETTLCRLSSCSSHVVFGRIELR